MKLKVGIIGLGIGRAHLEAFAKDQRVEVVAVCDYQQEKIAAVKNEFPQIATFTHDAAVILTDPKINIVSIASYDQDHATQTLQALAHNKHVFVEKPFCTSEKEAQEIFQTLQKQPHLKLSSNLILRRYDWAMRLKGFFTDGTLGTPYLLEGDYNYGRIEKITSGWRGTSDFYSVTYGGGLHLVDLLLWCSNARVREVVTYGTAIATQGTAFKFKDTVISLLKFENSMVAKLCSNFGCVYPHAHKVSVYGTKASYEKTPNGAYLYRTRDEKTDPEKLDNQAIPSPTKGALIPEFISSILEGAAPAVSSKEVFDAMAVCFAIERSLSSGQAEGVKYF